MNKEEIVEKIQQIGKIVKTSELYSLGISYRMLEQLIKDGTIKRIKNGYYSLAQGEYSENEYMNLLFPDGVLTLESALYYYGYLEEKPFFWKIAVDKNTSKSRFSIVYPIVIPVYTEPEVLSLGVNAIELNGNSFQIYDRNRLICDCLKQQDHFSKEDMQKILKSYIKDPNKDLFLLDQYARERKVMTKVKYMIGVWL